MDRNRKDLKETYKRLNSAQREKFVTSWERTGGADWGDFLFSVSGGIM